MGIDEQIVQQYTLGKSIRAIMQDFHRGKLRIKNVLQEHDIQLRPNSSYLVGNQRNRKHHIPCEDLIRMYITEGKSLKEIKALTGCSTIHRELKRYNIDIRDGMKAQRHEPTEAERGYAAGFIDGEGSIVIRKPSKTAGHKLVVSAGQSIPDPLEWLRLRWGGIVSPSRRQQGPFWNWYVCTHQALTFLQDIHPFLVVKSEEATIGITFQQRKFNGRRRTPAYIAEDEASRITLLSLRRNRPIRARALVNGLQGAGIVADDSAA